MARNASRECAPNQALVIYTHPLSSTAQPLLLLRHIAHSRNVTPEPGSRHFSPIAHAEITAIRMLKHHRTHAGLRIHHESFGKLHANFFRAQ